LAILNKEVATFPNNPALAKDLENTKASIARQERLLAIPNSSDAKATTERKVVAARTEAENAPDPLRRGAAAKEEGKVIGAAGGAAEVALAGSDEVVSEVKRNVNELLSHKGLKSAVGATLLPGARFIDGTKEADFMSRLKQIQGGAFLKAYETLKGGGQITEIEGQKATEAMNRMNKSTSEKEFKAAAEDFVKAIETGLNKLRMQAALMKKAQATNPTSLENQLAGEEKWERGSDGKLRRVK
jgi:flagellar protein FlgJ